MRGEFQMGLSGWGEGEVSQGWEGKNKDKGWRAREGWTFALFPHMPKEGICGPPGCGKGRWIKVESNAGRVPNGAEWLGGRARFRKVGKARTRAKAGGRARGGRLRSSHICQRRAYVGHLVRLAAGFSSRMRELVCYMAWLP